MNLFGIFTGTCEVNKSEYCPSLQIRKLDLRMCAFLKGTSANTWKNQVAIPVS